MRKDLRSKIERFVFTLDKDERELYETTRNFISVERYENRRGGKSLYVKVDGKQYYIEESIISTFIGDTKFQIKIHGTPTLLEVIEFHFNLFSVFTPEIIKEFEKNALYIAIKELKKKKSKEELRGIFKYLKIYTKY